MLGALLAGIVFLNVCVLELNRGIARTDAKSADTRAHELGAACARREARLGERIQQLAAARGLRDAAARRRDLLRTSARATRASRAQRITAPAPAVCRRELARRPPTSATPATATTPTTTTPTATATPTTATTPDHAPTATTVTAQPTWPQRPRRTTTVALASGSRRPADRHALRGLPGPPPARRPPLHVARHGPRQRPQEQGARSAGRARDRARTARHDHRPQRRGARGLRGLGHGLREPARDQGPGWHRVEARAVPRQLRGRSCAPS